MLPPLPEDDRPVDPPPEGEGLDVVGFFAVVRFAVGFFAVVFFAALDAVEAFFFVAEAFLVAEVDVVVDLAPDPVAEPPRRVADDTLCATLGAFSAIALPICGARLATWSPAARTALPTVGDVFDATFLATWGAIVRSVFAISGALSATSFPTAGAFFAISPTRSPSMSDPFLFAIRAAYPDVPVLDPAG